MSDNVIHLTGFNRRDTLRVPLGHIPEPRVHVDVYPIEIQTRGTIHDWSNDPHVNDDLTKPFGVPRPGRSWVADHVEGGPAWRKFVAEQSAVLSGLPRWEDEQ